ncbi:MAG: diguanylate cyclase [Abitibacteriaceae bacterium]|nr:diguanylate cyclase [Abditibacteriaceae bacterium]
MSDEIRRRVLIADDDPVMNRMLQATLQKMGHEVIVCLNGEMAWQHLTAPDAPPMAILDWGLPDMDGIELCCRLRQREDAPYVYIVLLTARGERDDLIKGLEAGADDYLIKPCDLEELKVRVRAGQRILDLQSKLLMAQAALQEQATHDALTGIWNRGAVLEMLHRELDRARRDQQPVGVIMADVDHFKSINDNFGHQAGDVVLRDVAQRIKTCLRAYDAVGRYGGEEFLMVLPKCMASTAVEIAERIRANMASHPVKTEAATIPATMSLGVVASIVESEINEQQLIGAADAALYKAKQSGRNRVIMAEG